MMRSTIESLVKLPPQLPFETSVTSKKEVDTKNTPNKSGYKKEAVEQNLENINDAAHDDTPAYSKGYIKYPRYDFF